MKIKHLILMCVLIIVSFPMVNAQFTKAKDYTFCWGSIALTLVDGGKAIQVRYGTGGVILKTVKGEWDAYNDGNPQTIKITFEGSEQVYTYSMIRDGFGEPAKMFDGNGREYALCKSKESKSLVSIEDTEPKTQKTSTSANLPKYSKKWMTKNLDVAKFRNGDLIHEAKTNEEWIKAAKDGTPAWCYYRNNPENSGNYGKLYNWFAVNDPRGLAPKGCHIPTQDEWEAYIISLGGKDVAAKKMKSTNIWSSGSNGTNSSGFNCLPSGSRSSQGEFKGWGDFASLWSATAQNEKNAYIRSLGTLYEHIGLGEKEKGAGASVRCIIDSNVSETQPQSAKDTKIDKSSTQDNIFGTLVDTRDGHKYRTVKIGSQTWMAENLAWLPSINPIKNTSDNSPEYYVYDYQGTNIKEATATANFGIYGVLYSWAAAKISCPSGFHLPSESEWSTLALVINKDLKRSWIEPSSPYWIKKLNVTIKSSGFSVLPGGLYSGGSFRTLGYMGLFWTSTIGEPSKAACIQFNDEKGFGSDGWEMLKALSVRCVKD